MSPLSVGLTVVLPAANLLTVLLDEIATYRLPLDSWPGRTDPRP